MQSQGTLNGRAVVQRADGRVQTAQRIDLINASFREIRRRQTDLFDRYGFIAVD